MPYKDPEKAKAAKKKWDEEHRSAGKLRKIWWGYLYEDSAPDDFIDLMRESGYEGFAMKHDRDLTAAGEVKEPHWHVVVRFSHAVQAKEAKEVLTAFGVKPASVQFRDSWSAVARYLCHLDDPNKTQYSPEHVVEFGGADYLSAINRSADKYRIVAAMQDWVIETECSSFAVLFDYARDNDMEWFMALCDNCSIVMREYIKSRRYDLLEGRAAGSMKDSATTGA